MPLVPIYGYKPVIQYVTIDPSEVVGLSRSDAYRLVVTRCAAVANRAHAKRGFTKWEINPDAINEFLDEIGQ